MPSTSPYAVAESEPPQWKPGELIGASIFTGISLFLILETLFGIIRLFQKRRGLYFWSMLAGTVGCGVDALGIILKYLVPQKHVWWLYTLCLLGGWTTYCLAQLLVLYSRLHLVNQNANTQRFVLLITLSTILIATVPTWIVVWPAYDPNPNISSLWSPRDAIVERYTQIVYTLVELAVSGIYITSLIKLLQYKSSVRTRRVMIDLMYVNVINVAFDVLCVVLIYLNQLGLSHPIQNFSYIFKLRLEFIVLNQLMSVAARGLKRETFEEKRYHHSSQPDNFSTELRRFNFQDQASSGKKQGTYASEDNTKAKRVASGDVPGQDSLQISLPSPALSKEHQPSISAISEDTSTLSRSDKDLPRHPDDELSEEVSQAPPESPVLPLQGSHPNRRRLRAALHSVRPSSRRELDDSESRPISRHEDKRARMQFRHNSQDDNDEEEIGLHMWENRGRVILEVPWFRSSTHPV